MRKHIMNISFLTVLPSLFSIILSQDVRKSDKIGEESVEDFLQVVNSPWFVDKTAMIEEFMTLDYSYTETTIPPRFGRSINLSMLKYFFDITLNETDGYSIVDNKKNTRPYKLFTDAKLNLSISKNKKFIDEHLGEYIVIHFSLKELHGKTMEEKVKILNRIFYKQICKKYAKWFEHEKKYIYSYCRMTGETLSKIFKGIGHDTNIIESNLPFLVTVLRRYYQKKALLLIDNFDSPAINAMFMNQDPSRITDFINRHIEQVIKPSYPKHAVERALLTGTFSCANTTLSSFMNLSFHSFLEDHKLSKFYGFTMEEVEKLFTTADNFDDNDKRKLVELYNGYSIERSSVKIFNPASVIRYLKERLGIISHTVESHRPPEGVLVLMNASMYHNESRKTMVNLLLNECTEIKECRNNTVIPYKELIRGVVDGNNTFYNDLFINFLFYNAYLVRSGSNQMYRISNFDIKREFQRVVHSFYRAKDGNLESVGKQLLDILNHAGNVSRDEIEAMSGILQKEFRKFMNKSEAFGLQLDDGEIRSFFSVSLDVMNPEDGGSQGFRVFNKAYEGDATNLILIHSNNTTALIVEFKYQQSVEFALKEAQTYSIRGIKTLKNIFYAGIAIDDKWNVKLDVKFVK